MSDNKKASIEEKITRLEQLLAWFETDDVTVEKALENYEQAARLAQELEADLGSAKNKIAVIKQKYSS